MPFRHSKWMQFWHHSGIQKAPFEAPFKRQGALQAPRRTSGAIHVCVTGVTGTIQASVSGVVQVTLRHHLMPIRCATLALLWAPSDAALGVVRE